MNRNITKIISLCKHKFTKSIFISVDVFNDAVCADTVAVACAALVVYRGVAAAIADKVDNAAVDDMTDDFKVGVNVGAADSGHCSSVSLMS